MNIHTCSSKSNMSNERLAVIFSGMTQVEIRLFGAGR